MWALVKLRAIEREREWSGGCKREETLKERGSEVVGVRESRGEGGKWRERMRGVSFRGPTLAFASVQPSPRVDLICGFDAASSMLVLTYSTGAPPLDPALPSHPFLSSHSCAAPSLLSYARAFVLLTILPIPPSFPTRWPFPLLPSLSPLQLFHVTTPLLSQSPASSFPHPTFP